MKNLPKKIYLNFGDDFIDREDYESTDFRDLSEVTWCEDRIYETDAKYVHESKIAKLEAEVARLKDEKRKDDYLYAECAEKNGNLRNLVREIYQNLINEPAYVPIGAIKQIFQTKCEPLGIELKPALEEIDANS